MASTFAFTPAAPRADMDKAVKLSIGLASPLWLAFGAAATAGAAWWWMTRWTRPVNLEAMAAVVAPSAPATPAPEAVTAPTPTASPAATKPEAVESAPAEYAAPAAEAPTPDDLTRIFGIGPRLAQALADRGVASFARLAACTADEIAAMDAELNLKGRAVRDAWVAQAGRLAKNA